MITPAPIANFTRAFNRSPSSSYENVNILSGKCANCEIALCLQPCLKHAACRYHSPFAFPSPLPILPAFSPLCLQPLPCLPVRLGLQETYLQQASPLASFASPSATEALSPVSSQQETVQNSPNLHIIWVKCPSCHFAGCAISHSNNRPLPQIMPAQNATETLGRSVSSPRNNAQLGRTQTCGRLSPHSAEGFSSSPRTCSRNRSRAPASEGSARPIGSPSAGSSFASTPPLARA